MSSLVLSAIIFITLALILYSSGIWGTRISKKLMLVFVVLLWLGWVCDATGTTLMTLVAGKLSLNIHSISGAAAILLMLGNAIWATIVYRSKNDELLKSYSRFSIVVWLIWLIPFVGGMVGAMM